MNKLLLSISAFLLTSSFVVAQSGKLSKIGERIDGHFTQSKTNENLFLKLTKKGHGNPVENGVPDEYALFSNAKNIKSLKIGCCEATLINEGDLNGDGLDEVSVVQAPMNGCTYTFSTYTLSGGIWKKLFEPFMFSSGCDPLSYDDLQKKLFIEKGVVYSLQVDPNDEDSRPIKKKMKLLSTAKK